MLGKKGGLAKKLEDKWRIKLFKTHCKAHKLELVVKNAIKVFPQHEKFKDDVNSFAQVIIITKILYP